MALRMREPNIRSRLRTTATGAVFWRPAIVSVILFFPDSHASDVR